METISQLRTICQQEKKIKQGKSKSYFFHRKTSIYITWLLLHTPITANQVTTVGLLMSGLGCLLIIPLNIRLNIFGFLLCYLAFLLDKVDGEIARYRHSESSAGLLLDEIWHLVFPFTFFFSLSFNMYLFYKNFAVFILGLFLAFLAVLIRFDTRLSRFIFVRTLLLCKDKDQLKDFIKNIKGPAKGALNWNNKGQGKQQRCRTLPLQIIFSLHNLVYMASVRFVSAIFVFFIVFLLEEGKIYFPIPDIFYKLIFIVLFFALHLVYLLERMFVDYRDLKDKLISLDNYFQAFYGRAESKKV